MGWMKMKIADNRTTLVPMCGHERVQGRQGEPACNRSCDKHEIAIDRPAITQVAQQHHDEDSRERQLQSDAEDVHLFPSQKGRSSWGSRAGLDSADATGQLLRAPCGAEKARYSRITTSNALPDVPVAPFATDRGAPIQTRGCRRRQHHDPPVVLGSRQEAALRPHGRRSQPRFPAKARVEARTASAQRPELVRGTNEFVHIPHEACAVPAGLDVDGGSRRPRRTPCAAGARATCSSRCTTDGAGRSPLHLPPGGSRCRPLACSQSSSVKPSPSSANAARRSSRTAEISACVRLIAGTWRIATSGAAMAPRLPDWGRVPPLLRYPADWMAGVWDLRSVPAGRCACAPSISDAANDPRLPVTLHEGLLRNGKYSSHAIASAAGHLPGRDRARGGDLARAGAGGQRSTQAR